jgi:hypothetical protein
MTKTKDLEQQIHYYVRLLRNMRQSLKTVVYRRHLRDMPDETEMRTYNPFYNHTGLCWTMGFAYMFARKVEAQDIIDHRDETNPYARIGAGIGGMF